MSWQPTMSIENAKARAAMLASIRSFFQQRDVLEVDTPIMSHGTVTDVHLDAFSTTFQQSETLSEQQLYLQTSPEFAMKRLLAAGYPSIYQICKAFRHEGQGRYHNPEFTILEWYRLDYDHFQLMDEVSELLQQTLGCLPAQAISYQQAFIDQLGFDPLTITLDRIKGWLSERDKLSAWLADETDIDTLLQFVFADCIEPVIGQDAPCFVYGFPKKQAALARINADDNRIADRFECYYRGIELVNGFYELSNAGIQRKRFTEDNQCRRQTNKPTKPIDERFIAALASGLPMCSGVALGVDRLVMLATGALDIKQVLTFPFNSA